MSTARDKHATALVRSRPSTRPPHGYNLGTVTHQPTLTRTDRLLAISGLLSESDSAESWPEAQAYRRLARAFDPLLRRWGRVVEVDRPESRLDYALWRAEREGSAGRHLAFLPLDRLYLTSRAPNLAYSLWDLSDLPAYDLGDNPRNNWTRIADRLDLLLVPGRASRDAFGRAGVQTPVRVVPMPVSVEYFELPSFEVDQRTVLTCSGLELRQDESPGYSGDPWTARPRDSASRLAGLYRGLVKPLLPVSVHRTFVRAARAAGTVRAAQCEASAWAPRVLQLELGGAVYVAEIDPCDPRHCWQDLLSAYLLALGDRADATLVLRLDSPPEAAKAGLERVVAYYQALGLDHRCRMVLVTSPLSEPEQVQLARAAAYVVDASRTAATALSSRRFLAAGRPAIAPRHATLGDYEPEHLGFVVDAHPEPTFQPLDPARCYVTTWQRLVWQSLHDELRASYQLLTGDAAGYADLATRTRRQLADIAHPDRVWPLLAEALDLRIGAT